MTGSTLSGAWPEYLAIFLVSALLCTLLTPVAIKVAIRIRVFDHPAGHKSHESPVPYLGGVAIVLAFAAAVLLGAIADRPESGVGELAKILGLAVALAAIGLLDDLRNLSPVIRLAAEVAAGLAVWQMGTGVLITGVTGVDVVLTVLWVVGITNAFNLLDNMDGLAAGMAGIASLTFFSIASANGQFLVAALSIGLVGCSAGFLRLNVHPARVYMGDGGSLFLGFMVAYLGLKLRFLTSVSESFLVPVLACAPAILDTTLVSVSRLTSGRSPFQGGRDHVSHRLVAVGLPVPVAVGVMHLFAVAVGVICFVVSRVDRASAWTLAALVFGFIGGAGILLYLVPVYPESARPHFVISERSTEVD